MANYANLKSAIQQVIKTNGNNEITGALLQQSLLAIITSLGGYYQFAGIATPSTNPGTPDQNVFYIGGAGTYSNFSSLVIPTGYIGVLKYNGTWTLETVQAGDVNAVKFVAQTLTDNQKTQARTNIEAASNEQVSQLEAEVGDLENELGSDSYKDSSINYNWTKGLLKADGSTLDSSGSTYRYSALLPVTPGENLKIRVYSPNGSTVAFAYYAQDESVLDVSETGYTKGGTSIISVTVPNTAYYIRLQTNTTNLSEDLAGVYIVPFLPNRETVLKFSETSGTLNWGGKTLATSDDIEGDLKESDITIEVVSNNISDPSGIIDGKLVADGGAISNSASWSMYKLPVSPGDVLTFAGFYLGRIGYYAFYNDATFVSYGAYVDPNGVESPYTVTVPSGANLLYFDIKSGNSPSNPYSALQINEGNLLLPYDVFRKAVTEILGEDLISNGATFDIPDLIADLPLSADGTGIETGYAYINSSTGAVIVKQ